MKKQCFAIVTRENFNSKEVCVKYVQGYIYKCGGLFFGVRGSTGKYSITELSTGMLVSGGAGINPRKLSDIPDALVKVLQIPRLKECLQSAARFYPEQGYTEWEEVLRPSWETELHSAG